MISSKLIQIIYALGAVGINCWQFGFNEWTIFSDGNLGHVIGNLVWCLACEMTIISFRINEQLDQLGLIRDELKRSVK